MPTEPGNPTRVLLGVTGGIAAYKAPELVRRLVERGREPRGTRGPDTARSRELVRARAEQCRETAPGFEQAPREVRDVLSATARAEQHREQLAVGQRRRSRP